VRKRIPFAAVAAAATLAAGVVAGCGSSNNSSSTAVAAGSGLSGQPLRVGLICPCTGPVAGTYGGTPTLVNAWEQWTNKHGGINGHPVKVFVADDGDNPATSEQVLRQLVEQDKIQGLVDSSFFEAQWWPYLKEHQIPVTGGNSPDPQFVQYPLFFPSGSTFPVLYYGMADQLKKLGKTKVAVMVCAELPVCAGVSKLFAAVSEKVVGGVNVVYTGKIAATAPNYTAQCLAAKSSGADAAMYAHSSDVSARVATQCVQQGFNPQLFAYGSQMAANWLNNSAYSGGSITAEENVPLTDTTDRGPKAFHEAVGRYAPSLATSTQYGVITQDEWAGLELFKAAATAGNLNAGSTPQNLLQSMYTLKNDTLGGLAPPLNFTPGKPAFVTCYFVSGVKNGSYTAPAGDKPICLPQHEVASLEQTIAAAAG
jgi:branched-chain amino acid transport system substrate-binding protein